jgi:CRP-like cAMP-binding protein
MNLSRCTATPNLVSCIPLLKDIPRQQMDDVAEKLKVLSCKKGEVIFREGDAGDAVYFVLNGRVKLQRHTLQGRDVVVDVLGPGRVFGIMAAVTKSRYSAEAQALENAVLAEVLRSDFMEILSKYPSVAVRTSQELAERLRSANELINTLAVEKVDRRIAFILIKLARVSSGTPEEIELPLTRQDIADMAGTTVETAIRVINRFKKAKMIETRRGRIRIVDRESLLKYTSGRGK